jgi:D-alanine-D-alanine ligase-like ATP-grasp enzyme
LGSKYVAETVFTIEDAKGLKFPVIAKAEASWQSKGVEKFDTIEDLKSSKLSFDLYQEAFDIDKEYRAIIFKGKKDKTPKLLTMSLRTPANEKAKSLRISEGATHEELVENDNSKFTWTAIDIFSEDCGINMDEISKMVADVIKVSPGMNMFAIDVAIDKDGKYWLIEANTQPGQNGITSHLIYLNMVKDFYGLNIVGEDIDKMKTSMYSAITATRSYVLGYSIPDCLYSDPKYWYGVEL